MDELKTCAVRVFLGLLLLFQFSGFVSVLSENMDPRSILSSRDADAAHVVGTANKTRWYKDNGESAYGAFFYRLVHTFGQIAGRDFANTEDSASENSERAHHLVVMVLSLLCVYGISFLLGMQLWREWNPRLLFTFAMTGLLLANPTWATFVFRAHPDMLFGFVVLAAFVLTKKAVEEAPNSIHFKLAALLWGAAGMVKLSFVLFLPVIWFLFMPPFTRERAKLAARFYLWMLPSYLILGFPQSFNFPRSLKFLAYQSQFAIPATKDSLVNWLSTLTAQMGWPLLAILILAPFSLTRTRAPLRLLPLILFPLLMLLRQNSNYQMDYYLIPVIAISLGWAIWALSGRLSFLHAKVQPILLIGFATSVFFTVGFVPKTMELELQKTLGCRKEAQQIYKSIHAHVDQGRVFALDPYMAYDRMRAKEKVSANWANTWLKVKEINATALALNMAYAKRFTEGDAPTTGVQVDAPNWPETRSFYLSFQGQSEVADPEGGIWQKSESACDWEIWLKK